MLRWCALWQRGKRSRYPLGCADGVCGVALSSLVICEASSAASTMMDVVRAVRDGARVDGTIGKGRRWLDVWYRVRA